MTGRKDKPAVDRRELIALGAGGLGALALNAGPLSVASAFAATNPALPNFYPASVAPPDIPGDANGLEPGYIDFPKKLVKLVDTAPGRGGDVTAMSLWVWPIPVPAAQNAAWTQLNKKLNANVKMSYVPQPDYAAKWGTVTAGGDLPDLMYVSPVPRLPNVAAFVDADCVDLTQYLGGDAVKNYPALANIPTACWKTAIIGGKLRGVPIPRSVTGWPMFIQTGLLEKLGMAGKWPTNADDLKAFCKALTNPSAGRWAMGVCNDASAGPYSMYWFQGVFGAPNNWRLGADGSLVKDIETAEYKAALAYNRDLVQLGYVSPDVRSNTDLTNDLLSDRIVMRSNGWAYYKVALIARGHALNKTFRVVPPFGHDGGPGSTLLGTGNIGWAAMKTASPDRVKELLGIINYLSAPIGTEEYMATRFGVEGADWNYDGKGTPTYTKTGLADMPGGPDVGPWGFVASPAPFLYSSVDPQFAQFASAEEKKLLAVGTTDPTLGYYSPTDAKTGTQLEQLIFDRVSDIAAGRKPVSDLDQLVKDWKARGGDKIRGEYEKAIAS